MVQLKLAPSVLVAIASHGTAQDHYLVRLLSEYRKLPMRVRAVVLTDAPKPVPGAEVIAGLPLRNPYSLPFAHRQLFGDNVADYDLFIYSEDDTLITERHMEAFLDAQSKLRDDEIAGFIRSETDPHGRLFITSIHHHFRWLPESVVERGGELFARLSNEHSGCFIATRKQLQKAIASGGFLVPPHAERYGMLETAACDLYTQCGLRRLISLSRIHDFIVPHLPNKYYSQMGIPVEDLDLQVASLRQLRRDGGWAGKLFEPESGAPRFRWSKNLYERPDERLLEAIPHEAQSVLSVGCGWGENEAWLIRRRLDVCAVPLDAVFGAFLRNRGIRAVIGPLSEALDSLRGERFDAVLLADVLHLVGDPVDWLRRLASFLKPDGRLVASVPNTGEIASRLKHWREGRGRLKSPGDPVRAAHQVSVRRLRSWLKAAGLAALSIAPCREGSERPLRRWASELIGPPMAPRFILSAGRSDSNP